MSAAKPKSIVKIVLWVIVALFCLGILGAYLYFSNLPPKGKIVLMAPGEASVVLVDGERIELDEKGRRTLELESGPHQVEVLEPVAIPAFEVLVPEFETLVVPIAKPQCYAILDVSQSAYDVGKQLPPKFVRAVQHDAPFELERDHYTSSDKLPAERTSGQLVFLLGTSTCEAIAEMAAQQAE